MLLQAPQSAYRIGCLAAAPPTRIEGRLRREGLTRHEASSTPHVESPRREAPSGTQRRRVSVRSLPSKGAGSALERRMRSRDRHRARAARSHPTRRRYRYVRGQVRCAPGETRKEKKGSKELDNCGHIEGLLLKAMESPMKAWPSLHLMKVAVSAIFVGM